MTVTGLLARKMMAAHFTAEGRCLSDVAVRDFITFECSTFLADSARMTCFWTTGKTLGSPPDVGPSCGTRFRRPIETGCVSQARNAYEPKGHKRLAPP